MSLLIVSLLEKFLVQVKILIYYAYWVMQAGYLFIYAIWMTIYTNFIMLCYLIVDKFRGLGGSIPAFNNVRAALVFSNSSAQSDSSSSHMTRPRGHMTERRLSPAVTPLAPRYVQSSSANQ